MNTTSHITSASRVKPAACFWVVAGLALVWNLFGAFQFSQTAGADAATLIAQGMTAEQASFYAQLPMWLHAVFAVGVGLGSIGCVLLLLRSRWAVPAFAVSLVGYVLLFIADWTLGVFGMFGTPQVAILSTVVAIAALLLWWSRRLLAQRVLG